MKILSMCLSTALIVMVFLYSCAVSEKYRCKNNMVFRSYVYMLEKSHNNKKAQRTFSCVSLLNFKRYLNSDYSIKFTKTKSKKYLKYKKKKYMMEIENGLRP